MMPRFFSSVALSMVLLSLMQQPSSIQGFGISNVRIIHGRRVSSIISSGNDINSNIKRSNVILYASEGGEADADADASAEESSEEGEAEAEAETETKEKDEDDVEAIKATIAELEATLKSKNREINNIEKLGEQYTEAGYAREVAKMESYRRSRSANAADGQLVAKAGVLQNFLPIVDELQRLSDEYESEGNDFAQKYSALASEFNGVMSKMGVAEYTVSEGDVADVRRVTAVKEVHSDTVAKGCVVEVVEGSSVGYELEGNVMRMVEAVVSLGPEEVEVEAEAEEEEAKEEGTDDEKPSEE